jgi:hypothetical protein
MQAVVCAGAPLSVLGVESRLHAPPSGYGPVVTTTLLIGAAPYQLNEDTARWLETMIRRLCVDDGGHALDIPARACLQLADMIAESVERGEPLEPIELGRLQAEGLLAYVLRDETFQGHAELATLYWGLRRFRDSP